MTADIVELRVTDLYPLIENSLSLDAKDTLNRLIYTTTPTVYSYCYISNTDTVDTRHTIFCDLLNHTIAALSTARNIALSPCAVRTLARPLAVPLVSESARSTLYLVYLDCGLPIKQIRDILSRWPQPTLAVTRLEEAVPRGV